MKIVKGFTLVELIVVVAIVGLLASVAHPFYKEHQAKVSRADAQAELARVAQQLQFYYSINNTYTGANPLGKTNSMQFPKTKPLYTISATITDNATTGEIGTNFVLRATPIAKGKLAGDGVICLNNIMQRSWSKGARGCNLTQTSTWYGEAN